VRFHILDTLRGDQRWLLEGGEQGETKKTKVPRNTKEQFVRFINYYLRAGEERKEKEHEKERKEKQKVTT
tara:strand:+ start:263 stop:472 length:210 start_codon:yes stop_codon:yes gene_type:complete